METTRKYMWKPDSVDDRDFLYPESLVQENLPTFVDLRGGCSPVQDQKSLGSCTSHATISGAFEYLQLKELKIPTISNVEFGPNFQRGSRLFHYYNERVLEGNVNEDAGAELRDAVKALAQYGVCTETLWPYHESKFADKPLDICYTEASKHKITEYIRLQSLDQVKLLLSQGYPVIFGMYLYDSFQSEQVAETGIVPMPNTTTETFIGGHAVCAVGYDDARQVLIVRNSWSRNWGDEGYFYLPYEYASNVNLAMDYWVIQK